MRYILMVIITSIILPTSSCDWGVKNCFATYTILNNSHHKIALYIYKHDSIVDTILLPTIDSDTVYYSTQKGDASGPPPFLSNEVRVVYDDSVTIVHYRLEVQEASRSILSRKSWSGPDVNGQDYAWVYLFTNDDYEEALLFQR